MWRRCVVIALAVACKVEDPPPVVCAEVAEADCDATEGCHLREALPVFSDAPTGWTCWSRVSVVAACVADLPEDRCPAGLVMAQAGPGSGCLLFDDVCTPELWEACTNPPDIPICPLCSTEDLPVFVGADVTVSGDDGFGRVVGGGDLDDDGVGDLVVGDGGGLLVVVGPLADGGTRHRVAFGDRLVDRELTVATGDVTHDGIDDLVIGAPSAPRSTDTSITGGLFVVPGPITGDVDLAESEFWIEGAQVGEQLGTQVAVRDMNGDGGLDVVVLAPSSDVVASNGASLDVWFGPIGAYMGRSGDADLRVAAASGAFGRSWALGELDGDPALELIAPVGTGRVVWGELPAGGVVDVASWDVTLVNDWAESTPASVAIADVDGDDVADVVLGAPDGTVEGLGPAGHIDVLAGPLVAGTVSAAARLDARCGGDTLGRDLWADDLDGDGDVDLLARAAGATSSGISGLLRPGPVAEGGPAIVGALRLGAGAWSVAAVVDVDGDGVLDVVGGDATRGVVEVWSGPIDAP